MRIAIACGTNGWGGSEKVALDLAAGFAGRGHAVSFFCKAGSPVHRRANDRFHTVAVLGGADFNPFTIARSIAGLRDFRADVVLANSVKDPRGIGIAARLLGIPFVYRKEVDEPFRTGPYHRLIHDRICQTFIVASAATRKTLLDSAPWLDAGRIHVIPNGIDIEQFATAEPEPLDLESGGCVFGFVGRFEERKGVYDLAKAWKEVAHQRPGDRLVLVGWGDGEPRLREMLDGVPGVVWLGPRDDVPALMKAFDVLVAPSHYEGFGLVLVEAMAAGRPVISTTASSMPEIVGPDERDRLVPPRDPTSLARAMFALAADPWQRDLIGQKNQARARERFTLDRMIDAHLERLGSIVGA